MPDFSTVDTSIIKKMALILGISSFGVLVFALILVKLLKVIKVPKSVILPLVRLGVVIGFLYLVVILGEKFM
jgi:hypothetical protein